MLHTRMLTPADDARIAAIIRANLKAHGLDVPGTVYFDPELDHLSAFYAQNPGKRAYFVALDDAGQAAGGVGFAEFPGFADCAELQKLYLDDSVKGRGLGTALIRLVQKQAAAAGYRQLYLETHTALHTAMHAYERAGFLPIEKPPFVQHATMNCFYLKAL